MATQTGPIKFKGKLGPLIGYYRNGKYVLRSRPAHVQQTSATKRSAGEFGMISKKARLIRRSIVPHLNIRYDGSLVNRLNRALIAAGCAQPVSRQHVPIAANAAGVHAVSTASKHPAHFMHRLPALEGFHFNPHTGLRQVLAMEPVYQNGTAHLPAQLFRMTHKATHMEVRAIGVRINFEERRLVAVNSAAQIIDPHAPFNGLDLPLSVPGKGPLFVILQLRAGTMHNGVFLPMGDKRYMAADIIAVSLPASTWHRRSKKPVRGQHVHRSAFTRHALAPINNAMYACTLQHIQPRSINAFDTHTRSLLSSITVNGAAPVPQLE